MYFTVYRTTNKVNGKYYFGVHKTIDPMDEYLGSGRWLKRAIAKYGEENFVKEILLSSHSPEAAFALEYELIEKHRGNPLCYNLRQGGSGGFDYINRVGLNGNNFITKEVVDRIQKTKRKKFETDSDYRQKVIDHLNRIRKMVNPNIREMNRRKAVAAWKGGHQTQENCRNFSNMRTGKGNPNFGKRWIIKDGVSQRVNIDQVKTLIDSGWALGRRPPKPKKERRVTIKNSAPDGMTWCSTHKQYMSVALFHHDKQKGGYKPHCIECRKKKREGKKW